MNIVQKSCLFFTIVGAINWGLIGLFDFNLVSFLFDGLSVLISRIIYTVVGVCGLISVVTLFMPALDGEYRTVEHM